MVVVPLGSGVVVVPGASVALRAPVLPPVASVALVVVGSHSAISWAARASRRSISTASEASASIAIRPPSPLLSARRISTTYFSVTTSIRPQKIVETAPMRCAASNGMPVVGLKISFIVYSGLVPMSP